MLAAAGFDGALYIFEHRFGYLATFKGEEAPRADELTPSVPLEILTDFGLAPKPYPSCGATHPGIEGAVALNEWLEGAAIDKVEIGYPSMAQNPLIYRQPQSPLEGKFSIEYCVAAALLDGEDEFRESRTKTSSEMISTISSPERR